MSCLASALWKMYILYGRLYTYVIYIALAVTILRSCYNSRNYTLCHACIILKDESLGSISCIYLFVAIAYIIHVNTVHIMIVPQ